LDPVALFNHLHDAESEDNRKFVSHRPTNLSDNFHGKAPSILAVPSVLIRSFVRPWRKKLMNEVSMGPMNLYRVKTGLLSPVGRLAEVEDRFLDLLGGHLLGRRRSRISGNRGGRLGYSSYNISAGNSSGMVQLERDPGAVFMNGIHETPKPGNKSIFKGCQTAYPMSSQRVNGARFRDNKAGASPGPLDIIVDGPIRDDSIFLPEICPHGRHDDPISERQPSNPARRKQFVKVTHRLGDFLRVHHDVRPLRTEHVLLEERIGFFKASPLRQ
jgi:hypothetical protein